MRFPNVYLPAFILFLFVLIRPVQTPAQDSTYFFSADKVFHPIEAGIYESRIGFQKYTNNDYLKLDIGATFDVAGIVSGEKKYSAGVDFFTFSNLRSEDNFKFPVDAIDYFFGVNFNFSKTTGSKAIQARLRIAHISSHLQDGHIYERTDTIFTPFVFSKEFADLAANYINSFGPKFDIKGQLGMTYIFSAIPKEISPLSGTFGLEARYFITGILSIYASSETIIASVSDDVNLNESFETGITLGKKGSRGVTLFYSYYDGQDYRGQYYGNYLNTKGIGMKVNF